MYRTDNSISTTPLLKRQKSYFLLTDKSVSEIHLPVGIEHSQSFSKLFKTRLNSNPCSSRSRLTDFKNSIDTVVIVFLLKAVFSKKISTKKLKQRMEPFGSIRYYFFFAFFFGLSTSSFNALPAENLGNFFAAILSGAPV